ncbi:MAG TPA: transposase [Chloroflexia bacterium]|nr:transposase [Chloroflexia bacterium]
MHLPDPIIAILIHFQPLLTAPTYRKMLLLVCGTLLAKGRRTVTAALKILGLEQDHNWPKFHNVLNRAKWDGLAIGRILLKLLITTFLPAEAPVEVVLDETLERRWGRKIKKKGHWRDSAASSHGLHVATIGLRWLVAALVVKLPWSKRPWALPFVSVLLTTPKVSKELGLQHYTYTDRTVQLVKWLRRNLGSRPIKIIGDGAYSSINLGLLCQKLKVTLIAPMRLDARLFGPQPARTAGTMGRPRGVGYRLPYLRDLGVDLSQAWELVEVGWYAGSTRKIWLLSGTGLWYSTLWGEAPLPLRWVLVRDPQEKYETRAYFSTDQSQSPAEIVGDFVKRWNIEVTFEESRAHLGVETQRQWSDKAIERTTPVLFGLFSLACLFADALHPEGKVPLYQTAW